MSYGIGVSGRPGNKQRKIGNQTLVALIYIPMEILTHHDWMDARRPVPRLWIRSAEVRGERR